MTDYSALELGIAAGLVGLTVLTFLLVLRGAARREKRDREILEASVRDAAHKPASLHPLIDSDVCIGSMACISACPEGNVLGMIEGSSALIKGSSCIGHGRCAAECPVDAITLVMGDTERGVDLPHLDRNFESSRKGVYVIGELAGMGLIKNAVRQGLLVMEYLGEELQPEPYSSCDYDLCVVGAGPAGITAAVAARARNLTCLVLEQGEEIGGTITTYHRQKLVTSENLRIPLYGTVSRGTMTKEEALELWQDVAKKTQLQVALGNHVEGIEGTDGHFIVRSNKGVTTCRKVILATGIRGTPMRLGVPGENSPNVSYRLVDPWQYVGQRVLVVGGGDSALEAACALGEAGVEVSISYRQNRFARARAANIKNIDEAIAAGKVTLFLGTRVTAITPNTVLLESADKAPRRAPTKLPVDYVVICAGGTPPSGFLRNIGVALEQFKGEAPRALAHIANPRHRNVVLPTVLAVVGLATIAALAAIGWDYYWLPRDRRFASPLHATLRPAGEWGRNIGIASTVVMMLNFTLAARKRIRALRGLGNIRDWLTFHVFVGLMAPACTAFHAAFQYENAVAVGTAAACAIVVLTGLVGRYLYQLVPGGPSGRPANLSELSDRVDALRRVLASTPLSNALRRLLEPPVVKELPAGPSQLVHLPIAAFTMTANLLEARLQIRAWCRRHEDQAVRASARDLYTLARLREQLTFYPALKRFMATWRAFHVTLAIFLVLLIALHIGVSFMVGFGVSF